MKDILNEVELRNVLKAVQALSDAFPDTRIMSMVVSRLREMASPQTVVLVVNEITDPEYRAKALIELIPFLPSPERATTAKAAVDLVRKIDHSAPGFDTYSLWDSEKESLQTELVVSCFTQYCVELARLGFYNQSLETSLEIEDMRSRAEALASLSHHLPETQRKDALREAFSALQSIKKESWQAKALSTILSLWFDGERPQIACEALLLSRSFKNLDARMEVSLASTPYLPESERVETLRKLLPELLASEDDLGFFGRDDNIGRSALQFAEMGFPHEALETVKGIGSAYIRATTLLQILSYLSGNERLQALDETMSAARETEYVDDQVEVLLRFSDHLSDIERIKALREAVAVMRSIEEMSGEESLKARLWGNIASRFAEFGFLQEIGAVMQSRMDVLEKIVLFRALSSLLSESKRAQIFHDMLASAHRIESPVSRAESLSALSTLLDGSERMAVLTDAQEAAQGIDRSRMSENGLEKLALKLAKIGFSQEAMSIACEIKDAYDQVDVLAKLVPYLADEDRILAIQRVLDSAKKIEGSGDRASVLAEFTAKLPEGECLLVRTATVVAAAEFLNYCVPALSVEEFLETFSPLPQRLQIDVVSKLIENEIDKRMPTVCRLGSRFSVYGRGLRREYLHVDTPKITPKPSITYRYGHATFPGKITVGHLEVLRVEITLEFPGQGAIPLELELAGQMEIDVLVGFSPLDFELQSPAIQTISLSSDIDSVPILFKLIARREGPKVITAEFFQNSRYLGRIELKTEALLKPQLANPVFTQTTLRTGWLMPSPDLTVLIDRITVDNQRFYYRFRICSYLRDINLRFSEFKTEILPNDPRTILEELFEDLNEMIESDPANGSIFFERLNGIGTDLYNRLFPDDLKRLYWEKLRDKAKSIMIISDEPWIPWELVRPFHPETLSEEDGFLCEKFNLTRWLAGDGPPDELSAIRFGLVIDDHNLDLADTEGNALKKLFSDKAEEIPANLEAIYCLLRTGGYSFLHFACHARRNPIDPDKSELLFDNNSSLIPKDLNGEKLAFRKDRPFIFLNACETGQRGYALTGHGGWVEAFLHRGKGSGFVGSMWQVSDQSAYRFAVEFYRQLLNGKTLAESAKFARLQVKKAGDPTWLSYTVYGNPFAQLAINGSPSCNNQRK